MSSQVRPDRMESHSSPNHLPLGDDLKRTRSLAAVVAAAVLLVMLSIAFSPQPSSVFLKTHYPVFAAGAVTHNNFDVQFQQTAITGWELNPSCSPFGSLVGCLIVHRAPAPYQPAF